MQVIVAVLLVALGLRAAVSALAATDEVVVLAVSSGDWSDDLNVHYLHRISLSTTSSSASLQNVSYDAANGSHLLLTTDLHNWDLSPASTSLPSQPLLLWYTGLSAQYLSLDLPSRTLRLHWAYPNDDRQGARLAFIEDSRSYWGVLGVNYIGSGPCLFVLSVYRDVGKAVLGGSTDKPAFQQSQTLGSDTGGICGVASDAARGLLFIAMSVSTFQGEVGSLLVYDTRNASLTTAAYAGAGSFGVAYSASRSRLFTYRQSQGNDAVVGIDAFDWQSGQAKQILGQSQLPELTFSIDALSSFFVDGSGEWLFVYGQQDPQTFAWTTFVFSVNVDTAAVSQVVQLQYPSPGTQVLAVYVRSASP